MALSEFYVAAVAAYMAAFQNGDSTKKLDGVYTKEKSTLDPGLVAIKIASIGGEELRDEGNRGPSTEHD